MVESDDDVIAMIEASVTSLLTQRHRRERIRRPGESIWSELVGLGLPMVMRPEAEGGANVGPSGAVRLARLLGSQLVPESLVGKAIVPDQLIMAMHGSPLQERLTASLTSGEFTVALAWQEAARQIDPWPTATLLDGRRLLGRKIACSKADNYLVTFSGPAGSGVAWVSGELLGAGSDSAPDAAGEALADLTLDVELDPADILIGKEVQTAVERAVALGALATAAQTLGACDALVEATLEHLRTRRQFGQPIGAFQALQHRAVDLAAELALTEAAIDVAARAFADDPDAAATRAHISCAKARSSSLAALTARESIQMHGAIGFTEEAEVGLFVSACIGLSERYGGARLHRRRALALTSDSE